MSLRILSLTLLAAVHATPLEQVTRQECKPCNPQGATGTNPPPVGSELKSMYTDLLASVKDIHFRRRSDSIEARDDNFCCQANLNCVNVQNLNIPMCYDQFTTNYAFPDGSRGSLTTGDYTSGESKANLITGDYTKAGGEQGNVYAEDPSAKPNTATLSIPPQYTASGVGSAVPATELGSVIIITTTVGGTTISGATILPETTVVATVDGSETAVTTMPERTVTGPTTIAPITTVVTSTPSQAAASSSTGAAGQVTVDSSMSFGMSLFTAIMYALYAL